MANLISVREESFGQLGYNHVDGSLLLPKDVSIEQILRTQLSSPLFMVWEITKKCNLHCRHCSNADLTRADLGLTAIFKIIEILKREQIFHVILSGGEPLLRDDIFTIFQKLNAEEISFDVCTNGTILNTTLVKKLKKSNPRRVYISLDGLESAHDTIRGKGSFQKALRGLRLLKKYELNVGIIFTLMKTNLGDLDKFMDWLVSERVHFVNVNDLMPLGSALADYDAMRLTPKELAKAVTILNKYKNKIDLDSEVIIDFTFHKTYKYSYCGLGKYVARIKYDGTITPCSFCEDSFGNILKIDFQSDFWKNPKIKNMTSLPVICKKCPDEHYCAGGCRVIAQYYSKKKNTPSSDIRCLKQIKN
jgi:radical SAM protein with 4Fe4S-binding SPASM domain